MPDTCVEHKELIISINKLVMTTNNLLIKINEVIMIQLKNDRDNIKDLYKKYDTVKNYIGIGIGIVGTISFITPVILKFIK